MATHDAAASQTTKDDSQTTINEVNLDDRGTLSLACNWGVGIGGGLWSTGLLLIQHICKHSSLYDEVFKQKRILELGSGTGLVGLAATRFGPPREVVITDLTTHLDICRDNVRQNTCQSSCRVRVEEFDWDGEVPVEVGARPFDVILGTDVAYHEHLYKPLIQVGLRDYRVSLYAIRRRLPSFPEVEIRVRGCHHLRLDSFNLRRSAGKTRRGYILPFDATVSDASKRRRTPFQR